MTFTRDLVLPPAGPRYVYNWFRAAREQAHYLRMCGRTLLCYVIKILHKLLGIVHREMIAMAKIMSVQPHPA